MGEFRMSYRFLRTLGLMEKPEHLAQAERYTKFAIERLLYRGLFRGATGVNHHEGDMMMGNLVYNLVWLNVAKEKANVKVEPNYFNRSGEQEYRDGKRGLTL